MTGGARFERRSVPIALLLGCALLLRVLIPAGWMPASGQGFAIQVCADGSSSTEAQRFAAAAQRQFQERLGKAATDRQDGDGGPDHAGKDQPCAFAGLALASLAADAPVLQPPPRAQSQASSRPAPAAIGQGLAAPPPPSTGPPLFA